MLIIGKSQSEAKLSWWKNLIFSPAHPASGGLACFGFRLIRLKSTRYFFCRGPFSELTLTFRH